MANDQSTVAYREIPGHPGYRVGDDGSVWSCFKAVGLGLGGGTKRVIGDEWVRLKPTPTKRTGHLVVSLHPGNRCVAVHRLVLEAFVGPRPEGMQACHFPDRDPANNRLSNLRWDTPKENTADQVRHGTRPRGVRHGRALLTESQVQQARADYATGEYNFDSLGKKYGVNKDTIRYAVRRLTWKHLA